MYQLICIEYLGEDKTTRVINIIRVLSHRFFFFFHSYSQLFSILTVFFLIME